MNTYLNSYPFPLCHSYQFQTNSKIIVNYILEFSNSQKTGKLKSYYTIDSLDFCNRISFECLMVLLVFRTELHFRCRLFFKKVYLRQQHNLGFSPDRKVSPWSITHQTQKIHPFKI